MAACPGGSVVIESTPTAIASQAIAVPSNGYVLVIGTRSVETPHARGISTAADFGVSDVAGALPADQDVRVAPPSTASSVW